VLEYLIGFILIICFLLVAHI